MSVGENVGITSIGTSVGCAVGKSLGERVTGETVGATVKKVGDSVGESVSWKKLNDIWILSLSELVNSFIISLLRAVVF